MATAICSVCKTDQEISRDGNWVVVHPANSEPHQCQGSGYPPSVFYDEAGMKRMSLDEKQKLLGDIENDLWGLLEAKHQGNADYLEILPLLQGIEQCRQIQMSFPVITVHSDDARWELSGMVVHKNGRKAKGEVELYTAHQWEFGVCTGLPTKSLKLIKGIYKLPHLRVSETYVVVYRAKNGSVILYDGRKGPDAFVTGTID